MPALQRCLGALAAQTVVDELEVVVVDDGSIDAAGVAGCVSQMPGARLVVQRGSGPAAARNAGVRAASGTFVCFTDDDCEPRPDWVEMLVNALRGGADAVAGRTLDAAGTSTVIASELIARAHSVEVAGGGIAFAPSNNLACATEVASALPFDERYPAAAGEDRDWCARLIDSGRSLRAEPRAVVVHHQRLNLSAFVRQQVRYGRGSFRFHRLGAQPRRLAGSSFYVRLVRSGFARGVGPGSLVVAAQFITAAGFGAEWLKARREGPAS